LSGVNRFSVFKYNAIVRVIADALGEGGLVVSLYFHVYHLARDGMHLDVEDYLFFLEVGSEREGIDDLEAFVLLIGAVEGGRGWKRVETDRDYAFASVANRVFLAILLTDFGGLLKLAPLKQ
jgi:hypothetical protein